MTKNITLNKTNKTFLITEIIFFAMPVLYLVYLGYTSVVTGVSVENLAIGTPQNIITMLSACISVFSGWVILNIKNNTNVIFIRTILIALIISQLLITNLIAVLALFFCFFNTFKSSHIYNNGDFQIQNNKSYIDFTVIFVTAFISLLCFISFFVLNKI